MFNEQLVGSARFNAIRAIEHAFGSIDCYVYKNNPEYNIYHDVSNQFLPPILSKIVFQTTGQIKMIKKFGWFKEGENLPIVGFLPYSYKYKIAINDRIEVREDQGIYVGIYTVNNIESVGEMAAIIWVLNLSPVRNGS